MAAQRRVPAAAVALLLAACCYVATCLAQQPQLAAAGSSSAPGAKNVTKSPLPEDGPNRRLRPPSRAPPSRAAGAAATRAMTPTKATLPVAQADDGATSAKIERRSVANESREATSSSPGFSQDTHRTAAIGTAADDRETGPARLGGSTGEPANESFAKMSAPAPAVASRPARRARTDEQRLLSLLMTDYDAAVRPVLNASDAVSLAIGLTLTQIDVDERNQVLTTLVWLDQEWKDENLYWNPDDYNGLKVLRVPCRKLWLPDIVLYNSVEDLRDGYMPALAMVGHDGNVFWPPIVKFRGNCIIDIKYFPFDDQVCKMKLGSWAYDGSQVNLTKRRDGIDLTNYVLNGEWELLSTEVVRNVDMYPCCPVPYIDVTFTLHLRRRTLYYTYNIVIPCVMLSILTLLSFWMKPDSGEKINLGLTILLAFSVFMLLIAENMPATSFHVPIIGVYITSSMCITSLSVVVAVLVSNINQQGSGNHSVPRWLHRTMHGLSILMCVKMASWEERHCNIRQLAKAFISPAVPNGSSTSKKVGLSRKRNSANGQNGHAMSPGSDDCLILTKNGCDGGGGGGSGGSSSGAGGYDEDPLLSRLHSIIEHQEILLKQQTAHDDWHSVAVVVDRCLFWLYFVMLIVVSMTTLVFFPLSKVQAYKTDNANQLTGH